MTRDRSGMLNAYVPGQSTDATSAELIARRERLLGGAYRLFYDEPLHVVRGEGCWLYDPSGRAYLDAYNNVAVVGHSNSSVVHAICTQAAVLNTHTRYLGEGILELSERLLETLPPSVDRIMYTCSGSEANDLAIRMAEHHTRKRGIIVTQLAYHGVTNAVAAISPSLGIDAASSANVRVVRAPNTFRLGADAGNVMLADVHNAIGELNRAGHGVAAMFCDPILSSDGVFASWQALSGSARAVQAAGGLFVADEVQSGFHRTGRRMWGFDNLEAVPDIVTMGKPMGNGHPVAAMAARADIVDGFGDTYRYFNTFGGNTVSCAAALATLDFLQREELGSRAEIVGERMRESLTALAERHPAIGDVRGAGLFVGVELVAPYERSPDPDLARAIVNGMRRRSVLISLTGLHGNVLKIRPPLVWGDAETQRLVEALDDCLVELVGMEARDQEMEP